MANTRVTGNQVKDNDIGREDLNVDTTGKAVVRKLIQGTNVTLSSTGVDAGTGDVTINATAGGGAGSDTTAIHDNQDDEFGSLTRKTPPSGNDVLLIEDSESATAYVKKKILISDLPTGGAGSDATALHKDWWAEINVLTDKTTIADNDAFVIEDSAGSYAKKRMLFSRLKTAFNALFAPIAHVGGTGTQHGNATTGVAGFMTAADKVKMNSLGIRIEMNAAQTLGSGAWTALNFNFIDWQDNPLYVTQWSSGSPTAVWIKENGYYICTGQVRFIVNATGVRGVVIYRNGVSQAAQLLTATSGIDIHLQSTTVLALSVGDFIQLACYQNSGVNLNTNPASKACFLTVMKL